MGQTRFIPVDRSDIYERLVSTVPWTEDELPIAEGVLHYLSRLRQQDSCISLDRMAAYYDPFNPDDETVNGGEREHLDLEPLLNASATSPNAGRQAISSAFQRRNSTGF
jgi:hypothetical protein